MANSQYNIPPPLLNLSMPYSQLDYTYSLNVVQNPIRARCCGFGEKDRRPIDPPPVLELRAEDKHGNRVELKPEDSILFLAQCELYNADKTENRTLIYTSWPSSIPTTAAAASQKDYQNPSTTNNNTKPKTTTTTNVGKPDYVRNLIGSTVSNAYHLYNENDKPGTYFIFHDISIRTEGTFTLKFVFVNLAVSEPFTMTTHIQLEAFSAPFSVYPAKKFPGLTESTSLSRCFSKQGIKIPIRSVYYHQEDYDDQQQAAANSQSSAGVKYTRLPISDFLLHDDQE